MVDTSPSGRESSAGYPRYVLGLLTCVTVLNVVDRQLLSVLIDPIKAEFGVSDTAMGLLTGTSFALVHVAVILPIAAWADRGVRRSIIALALGVWSGFTLLTGFARGFTEMFLVRLGVGVGEAGGSAPAHSLLSDFFPQERRAGAFAVFVMGGPLGSMIAFAGGGFMSERYGWRMAFLLFGVLGMLLAILLRLTVREPRRGASEGESGDGPPLPLGRALRFLAGIRSYRHLALASGLNSVGLYAVLVWAVPYLMRVHGLSIAEAGARLAIAAGLSTALGTLACGVLADRLGTRDLRWLAWLPAITSALTVPFGLGFAFAPSASTSVLLLAPASFFAGTYFAPVFSAVQGVSAPRTRAVAAASVTIVNNLLGLAIAAPLAGWLNDSLGVSYGSESIRYSLAIMLCAHLGAAFLLFRSASSLPSDFHARRQLLEDES